MDENGIHVGHTPRQYTKPKDTQSLGYPFYTSDAADHLLCVDLGGRRIIKKKIAFHTDPLP